MIERSSGAGKYTIIPNAVGDDERLSIGARGVLFYLLCKPDDWQMDISDIQQKCNIGSKKVCRIICELCDTGYLQHVIKRGANGQITGSNYVICNVARLGADDINQIEPVSIGGLKGENHGD